MVLICKTMSIFEQIWILFTHECFVKSLQMDRQTNGQQAGELKSIVPLNDYQYI